MADVNGDGLSDLIVYSNGELKLKLNTGTDFQEKSLLSNNAVDGIHVLDCNGDGLLDILVTIPGKENSFIAFFKNQAMVRSSVASSRLQENMNGVLLTSSIIMVCQVYLLLAISFIIRRIQVMAH